MEIYWLSILAITSIAQLVILIKIVRNYSLNINEACYKISDYLCRSKESLEFIARIKTAQKILDDLKVDTSDNSNTSKSCDGCNCGRHCEKY